MNECLMLSSVDALTLIVLFLTVILVQFEAYGIIKDMPEINYTCYKEP